MPFVTRSILFLQASLAGIWSIKEVKQVISRAVGTPTCTLARPPARCGTVFHALWHGLPTVPPGGPKVFPKIHHADIPEPPPNPALSRPGETPVAIISL